MKTLLVLKSSIYSNNGQSSRLADQAVAGWRAVNPGGRVITRDLARDPVPHITEERFAAFLAKQDARTRAQQAVVDYSDGLIRELQSADAVVLGLPLYNFGVPSTLKAYFDHIARAGVTFKYTETGPLGLLTGKKVYVTAARGGLYAGTPMDTQTAYVRTFLGFLGMTDVEFVYAEGLAMGDESKQASLAQAKTSIERLNPELWRAAA
ncbi:MAG TPA: FMN-dependent NADH-azoreductase [Burkholderiales bacterium]|nr:FMN-dependent NADH-azoreductase [Burkholderiales bacterium]